MGISDSQLELMKIINMHNMHQKIRQGMIEKVDDSVFKETIKKFDRIYLDCGKTPDGILKKALVL